MIVLLYATYYNFNQNIRSIAFQTFREMWYIWQQQPWGGYKMSFFEGLGSAVEKSTVVLDIGAAYTK